jgi:hypothetical protein
MALAVRLLKANPSVSVSNVLKGTFVAPSAKLSQTGSGKLVTSGGSVTGGGYTNSMEYIIGSTLGNGTSFGLLTGTKGAISGVSSTTRGVVSGGTGSAGFQAMDYFTFASNGNAISFGTNFTSRHASASGSNGVYGLFANNGNNENNVELIVIATLGNGTSFGNTAVARRDADGDSNTIRFFHAGGYTSSPISTIEYSTISTSGNGTVFGDMTAARYVPFALADATRGVIAGGFNNQNSTNYATIEYITIATTGNTISFGSLTSAMNNGAANASGARGFFLGANSYENRIEYINVQTTGNSASFGTLATGRIENDAISNLNGGIAQ